MLTANSTAVPATRLRWWACAPHGFAVLTFVLTLPLLVLGAEVTTKKVGMVDEVGLRAPWHMAEVTHQAGGVGNVVNDRGLGWVIEHGHRTVGFLVGISAIALAVSLWVIEERRWLRWAGVAALAGVSWQGVLGILRIELQKHYADPDLGSTMALIHGCTAQLMLAGLFAIALWTSRAWDMASRPTAADGKAFRLAVALVGLMYLQIVFGAVMRHKELAVGTRIHVLLAFAVVGLAVWLGRSLREECPVARKAVHILYGLLAVQLLLGLETLLSKFAVRWPTTGERLEPMPWSSDLIRSGHYLVGALTFSCALGVALLAASPRNAEVKA